MNMKIEDITINLADVKVFQLLELRLSKDRVDQLIEASFLVIYQHKWMLRIVLCFILWINLWFIGAFILYDSSIFTKLKVWGSR